jgi:Paraquat-inducible protein A
MNTRKVGYTVRILVCSALLVAAAVLVYRVDTEMHANRQLRIDLAEIRHIRYDLLNANAWAARIEPIFSKRIAAFDLTSNKEALRPSINKMVERMLVQASETMRAEVANNKSLGIFGAQIGQFLSNSLLNINNLRAHVPEFTNTILQELGKPEAKQTIQQSLKNAIWGGSAAVASEIDMTHHSSLLKQYGCSTSDDCRTLLSKRIDEGQSRISRLAVAILTMAAVAFILMLIRKSPVQRSETVVLALFCAVLLWAGLRNPMIDIDARISHLSFQLSGERVEFNDQVLFFQSKSIIDVVRLLIETRKPGMVIVGLMVLSFSVIFPIAKLLASAIYSYRVGGLQENALVRFFALKSGKWSMADVLVVALFMAYIGFDGVISSQLDQLRGAAAGMDVLTTNNTSLQTGFYLFLSFCIGGLLLSMALERSAKVRASIEQPTPTAMEWTTSGAGGNR